MKYEGWKIGAQIKKLRKEKELTAESFGDLLGVSTSHIRQIEQGCRKMSIDLLFRLMEKLQVDANTLLVIQKCEDVDISIDEQMVKLSKEHQQYFRNIFLQMLQEFPM